MYYKIFTISLSVILFLVVGLGILFGRKYKWYYSLSKVGSALASAVGAFFLSGVIAELVSDYGYSILINKLPAKITDVAKAINSAPQVFSALLTIILTPAFFVALYFIFKAIINCIIKNVCIAVAKKKALSLTDQVVSDTTAETVTVAVNEDGAEVIEEVTEEIITQKPRKIKRVSYIRANGVNPTGMICGVLCGLISFLVISIPLVGAASITDDVLSVASKFIADSKVQTATEIANAAATNPISRTIGKIGGEYLFETLTTTELGEYEVSLNEEVELVTSVGNALHSTINNKVSREEAAADIRKVSAAFSDADLIPAVLPDVFCAANASWEKGETFLGIKKITGTGRGVPIVEALTDILVDSDYNSIKKDTDTITEILAILVEHDAINTALKKPMALAEDEEMTVPVIYELLNNDHLTPLVNSLARFGVQYIGGQLGLRPYKAALYNEFSEKCAAGASALMTAELTDPTEQLNAFYKVMFDSYGLDVTADSISLISSETMVAFPEGGATIEDYKKFLSTIELTLNNGKKITLSSSEVLAENTILVCIDEIELSVSSITDKNIEAHALAKAAHEMAALTSILKSGGIKDAASIQKIGPILDALAHTETLGATDTGRFLTGILQSEMVYGKIGFSLVSATSIADTINSKSITQGYSPLLKSLSDTVDVVKLTIDSNATREEIHAKVEVLLDDLTPESAEVLQQISTPEVMVSQGVPEQSAESVSDLVSNMFGNLADAKDSGMSDEDYKKEAEATSNLLNMALAATSSGGSIFADVPKQDTPEGGEDTETDSGDTDTTESTDKMTAAEYIDSVMNSTVISQTIIEATYTDDSDEPTLNPLNMSKDLSQNEQEQVLESLNSHWANATDEQKADADYFKTYAAIGAMVNFPVTIGADGTIVPVNI